MRAGNHHGFLIGGPKAGRLFTVKRSDDFDVSDCAITPGGDLLLLERCFSWTQRRRDAHPPRAARRPSCRARWSMARR